MAAMAAKSIENMIVAITSLEVRQPAPKRWGGDSGDSGGNFSDFMRPSIGAASRPTSFDSGSKTEWRQWR